ncbi:hypothetical protein GCM10018773_61190 [Streptomyces candidus]|nr:hypothetical protein GCM10018773_61190 [Streptomyces candidus]
MGLSGERRVLSGALMGAGVSVASGYGLAMKSWKGSPAGSTDRRSASVNGSVRGARGGPDGPYPQEVMAARQAVAATAATAVRG